MRFKKGLLLYNEQAGKEKSSISKQNILSALHEAVEQVEECVMSAPGSGEKICFHSGHKYDIIIIYGGDGTIHECINGIARLKKRPVVAILPGGTCNDFSRSLGVPKDLKAACGLLKTGTVRNVDIGAANERYFVNFWGIGLIAEASENIDENKKSMFGKVSYYLSALESIRHPSYFYYMIETDKEILKGKAVMAIALNGNYIGTINLPFKADHEDGYLDLVIVKEAGFPIIKEIIHTNQKKVNGEYTANLIHRRVKSFTISTEPPVLTDMDGEVYAATPPAICSVKSGYLRFVST